MIIVPPNSLIGQVTDRMPAVLPRAAWPVWFGETDASDTDIKGVLQTYDDAGTWTMTEQPSARSRRPAQAISRTSSECYVPTNFQMPSTIFQ